MNNKLNVLKELKQLQLQIAELAGKEPPAENWLPDGSNFSMLRSRLLMPRLNKELFKENAQ